MLSKIKSIFENKNFKSGSLYLFGNLFNKAISFITVPIFTRILTTSEYGIVSTYSSWVTILAVVIGLSLGNSIRNAYVDFREDLKAYISSIFTLSFLNFLAVFFLLVGINLGVKFVDMSLLILCLLQSFGTFIVNSIIIKYMMEEESFKRTVLMIIPNLLAAILSVVLILNMNNHKEYGRIVSMSLLYSIFGLFIFLYCLLKGKCCFNSKYWKYALSISLPLIFHGLAVNILSNFDRTIITVMHSTAETGIYSVVYNFGMIAMVITSSLESVWIPYFTRNMIAANKREINANAKLYVEICTVFFCAILVVSPEVLIWFASERYCSGVIIIAPIILASYFQFLYSLAVDTEYYYKKTQIIATNTIIAAAVNLVLNLIFIPKGGAFAAAYTTVVSYMISFYMHYRYCKKIDTELFPFSIFTIPLITIFIFVIFQYLTMEYYIMRWIVGIIAVIIYSLFIAIKEKDRLNSILGK